MSRIVLSHDELNTGARALDAHLAEGALRMSPMGTWAQRQGGRWVLMFPSSNEKVYGCDEQVRSWPVVGNANAGEQQ
ncbi:hypothetical protein PBI_CHEETOBRO_52 [Mycobacterium phage Cheetobro]|uniref:hypothetical protein n=1 Tax=Mycobacterium phage Cheetobro TaxID=1506716 RepID=UPI0004E5D890|nr:hypothetical protein PBI_CHEETOBRO_52 [Mycobacterium phage Cheetobro]AII27222.1 hypothetical protein PBI_CHEETOBRO_52 [Mycobacterium phage Cheetobro]ALA46323.1 hypothetical protein PBI_SLARP_52 [Mycobacterium phage Slarp]ASW31695.1 hypothetical protein SEA_CHANCELLOR_52 [Mycobacterium phage Chancellor]